MARPRDDDIDMLPGWRLEARRGLWPTLNEAAMIELWWQTEKEEIKRLTG